MKKPKKYKDIRSKDPVKYFNNWMRNVLRRTFFRWYERTTAMHGAKIDRGQYKCAKCLNIFGPKMIRVDHINPVVDPKVGFVNWNVYIERLFCKAENLQILCRPCHQLKTNEERLLRKEYKTAQFSDEARKRMSNIRKGHHDNLGIPKSAEAKVKMSKERKGKLQTEARSRVLAEIHERSKRAVIATNIATNETKEFKCIDDASLVLDIHASNISRVCRKAQNRTQASGWKFEYK